MEMTKLRAFFRLIKFEHTVFALPFAYLGMILAGRSLPGAGIVVWTTLAMVSARTAGMTLNRIIDLKIDAANPRTQSRPSVTGEIPVLWAWGAAGLSLAVFFVSAGMLNLLCLKLSPLAVIGLSGYHYVKRFSWICHFALGLVLGIAPLGGWLAVTGVFAWEPLLLSFAVMFWVAGFDILYSLQDLEFDKQHGLHSVPVKFGQDKALEFSFRCHAVTVMFLAVFGFVYGLGVLYWVGVTICGGLLWVEHKLVGDGDLNHIHTAFFTINGWLGILLLIFSYLEIFR